MKAALVWACYTLTLSHMHVHTTRHCGIAAARSFSSGESAENLQSSYRDKSSAGSMRNKSVVMLQWRVRTGTTHRHTPGVLMHEHYSWKWITALNTEQVSSERNKEKCRETDLNQQKTNSPLLWKWINHNSQSKNSLNPEYFLSVWVLEWTEHVLDSNQQIWQKKKFEDITRALWRKGNLYYCLMLNGQKINK